MNSTPSAPLTTLWRFLFNSPSFQGCMVQLVNRIDVLSTDETFQEQFSQELAGLSQHSGHPNVLQIFGFHTSLKAFKLGELALKICVLHEFCAGGTLRSLLDATPPAGPLEHIVTLEAIANGMGYLHSRKPSPVIHADLKAAVILLRSNQTPCIADYGLDKWKQIQAGRCYYGARGEAGRGEPPNAIIKPPLSPAWAAPELWQLGGTASKASDIYAFGMLVYEATTATAPWDRLEAEDIRAKLNARARPDTGHLASQPSLRMLVQRCWDHDGERRPDSFYVVSELLHEIKCATAKSAEDGAAAAAPHVSLPDLLSEDGLPWQPSGRDGIDICHLERSSVSLNSAGLVVTLRQQIVSLCSEATAQNSSLGSDFHVGRISVLRNPAHSGLIADRMWSLTSVGHPDKWSSTLPSFDDRIFRNSRHVSAWRTAALNRLHNRELYNLTSGGNPDRSVELSCLPAVSLDL